MKSERLELQLNKSSLKPGVGSLLILTEDYTALWCCHLLTSVACILYFRLLRDPTWSYNDC